MLQNSTRRSQDGTNQQPDRTALAPPSATACFDRKVAFLQTSGRRKCLVGRQQAGETSVIYTKLVLTAFCRFFCSHAHGIVKAARFRAGRRRRRVGSVVRLGRLDSTQREILRSCEAPLLPQRSRGGKAAVAATSGLGRVSNKVRFPCSRAPLLVLVSDVLRLWESLCRGNFRVTSIPVLSDRHRSRHSSPGF